MMESMCSNRLPQGTYCVLAAGHEPPCDDDVAKNWSVTPAEVAAKLNPENRKFWQEVLACAADEPNSYVNETLAEDQKLTALSLSGAPGSEKEEHGYLD